MAYVLTLWFLFNSQTLLLGIYIIPRVCSSASFNKIDTVSGYKSPCHLKEQESSYLRANNPEVVQNVVFDMAKHSYVQSLKISATRISIHLLCPPFPTYSLSFSAVVILGSQIWVLTEQQLLHTDFIGRRSINIDWVYIVHRIQF